MKKTLLILICFALCGLSILCYGKGGSERIQIIMETDMGNDVDDALAMDLLYKSLDKKEIDLLAVCLNKIGPGPARYVDILNTWYGYPDIPIGTLQKGAYCEYDGVNFAKVVAEMKDSQGTSLFEAAKGEYYDAVELYRYILSGAEDNSVVIASVGFSTNLAALLNSGPDRYSDLSGKELVARKVKSLVAMAGHFRSKTHKEYNILRDIPAAKIVFEHWPAPVVISPFDVGEAILYPGSSIENDFAWAKPAHPMVEAYKVYLQMPYDRPTWDPTAVLYALGHEDMFTVSEPGTVKVADNGLTFFTPTADGNCRYLSVTPEQAESIKEYFVEVITTKPKHIKK